MNPSIKKVKNWDALVPPGTISKVYAYTEDPDKRDEYMLFLALFAPYKYHQLSGDRKMEGMYFNSHKTLRPIFGSKWSKKNIQVLIDLRIVEIVKDYSSGHHPRLYRLTDKYTYSEWKTYHFKTDKSKRLYLALKRVFRARVMNDELARNQYEQLTNLRAPTLKEVRRRGIYLANGMYTHKGKRLVSSYKVKDKDKFYYVDDAIEMLKLYWPKRKLKEFAIYPGGYSCQRVTTAFTLLPSWVREMFTIASTGESLGSVDFSTLHPNIVSMLSEEGGSITHDAVAEYLGISRTEAKIEHLSFFNKPITGFFDKVLYVS